MSVPNMNTLMKRLEAATLRLEDLVAYYDEKPGDQSRHASTVNVSTDAVDASPKTVVPGGAGGNASNAAPTSVPEASKVPSGQSYPALEALNSKLDTLVTLSEGLDADLHKQVAAFRAGQLNAVKIATLGSTIAKPGMGPEFGELFTPVNTQISQINQIRDAQRRSKFTNHFATVAEGSMVLGWISTPGPADYVNDVKESAQFYANKVLKEFKEEEVHKEWVKAFLSFTNELSKTLADVLPDGIEWDPKGLPLTEALKHLRDSDAAGASLPTSGASSPAPKAALKSSGGPPPPPPPTSAQLNAGEDKSQGGPSMDALFADISKGTDIHSNLKHIDRKNLPKPSGPKPKPPKPTAKGASPAPSSAGSAAPAKQPGTSLVENKWTVENYADKHDIVVELEMKQTLFVENCQRCTIVVKNKGTSVTLNNCKKVGIMVDTLISGLDFLGCTDCQAQTNGRLASLNLDKSNNLQIYLNEESLEVDIRTINTWAINLEIPTGEPGDYEEAPIAEQISHTIDPKTRKVKSIAVAPGQ